MTKIISTLLCVMLCSTLLFAQDKAKASPAATVSGVVVGSTVTINYNQPSVKGRKIWGALVSYNEVWRTGANEATTFETTKDITVEAVLLPAGKYSFFTIPGEKEWTIIFNKVPNQWGAYKYDEKQDQLRVKVKPVKTTQITEKLTFFIQTSKVFFRWENVEVGINVTK